MKNNSSIVLYSLVSTLLLIGFINLYSQSPVPLHPDHGVALIWYGKQDNINTKDGIITTGQIVFMWRYFEPAEGNYNFTSLDEQLHLLLLKGLKTTIQINGNRHPDYIYQLVPYLKGIELPSTSDHLEGYGPPMYWHPVYKEKYSNMIHALAQHLINSPFKDVVLGIRQNYNAVGTEHHYIEPKYRDKNLWTLEPTASWGDSWPWTTSIAEEYKTWTLDMYIREFNPPEGIPVFIRASAISGGEATSAHISMVEKGELYLFHTSSEPQPRVGKNSQYNVFVNYAKTGKTFAFMESWSAANTSSSGWGWTKTSTPITKAQFNYWTLLCDLHCGATFPAMRPEDVNVAAYLEDYKFSKKYAGYIAAPKATPGAWIAFREGDYLVGDYTFHMERSISDNSPGIYNVDDDKYGLWARRIRTIFPMKISMDTAFSSSLENTTDVEIRLWYKDDGSGSFEVQAFGQSLRYVKTGSGLWKQSRQIITIKNSESEIEIKAIDHDLIIHMLEVTRGTANYSDSVFNLSISHENIEGSAIFPLGNILVNKDSATEISVNTVPEGFTFSHWSVVSGKPELNDSLDDNTTVFLRTGDAEVKALFKAKTYLLSTTIEGNGNIECTPDLTEFSFGSHVVLKALPDNGWRFSTWTGDIIDSHETINILMDSDKTLFALFEIDPALSGTDFINSNNLKINLQLDSQKDNIIITSNRPMKLNAIYLYNILGVPYELKADSQATTANLNISELKNGIYVLKLVFENNEIRTIKFVK